MNDISPYLHLAVAKKASDLYFTANAPAMVRVEGETYPVGGESGKKMSQEMVAALADEIMTAEQQATFRSVREVDFAIRYKDVGRFRVNVFRQRGSVAMVLRNIGAMPKLDTLGLPSILAELAMRKRGLILCVGPTGCGKSTTLAAMLDHRNANATGHILTIEDPLEFMHTHQRSIVNQREIGTDTRSYANALRSALREAPDVVQIGEIRDRETVEACLQLCATGHLAMSTLHSTNAYQTLQRIVSMYPREAREQLYLDLSLNLQAVISQRLVKARDGKRVAAIEILLNTPYVAELIVKGHIEAVREAMADTAQSQGMLTFDDSLFALCEAGRIDQAEALANADSRNNLESRFSFGR